MSTITIPDQADAEYAILINESQRKIFVKALKALLASNLPVAEMLEANDLREILEDTEELSAGGMNDLTPLDSEPELPA